MATLPQELPDLLAGRRYDAPTVLDNWVRYVDSYRGWNDRVKVIDQIARNEWHMVWPDQKVDRALPKIPNYVVLGAEYESHIVQSYTPTIACRPTGVKPNETAAAEKRERINMGYWGMSRVGLKIPYWAFDLQYTGLSVVKVLPDFAKPKAERFPNYTRLDPRTCYPSPIFGEGPFVDDVMVAYEDTVQSVEKRFKDQGEVRQLIRRAKMRNGAVRDDRVRVLEFYDDKQAMVIVQPMAGSGTTGKDHVVLLDEKHGIGKCPVAIGVRPSQDQSYRGRFDHLLAMLNTSNRLMTLHLDAAARKVYATLIVDEEVENPTDEGPGAILTVKDSSRDVMSHVGWLQHPASAYDGYQVMRQMDSALRTAVLLPPSLTGDPNESVTSAAGIGATQTMPNAEAVSLQRDSLAPMLQAANELAMRGDEKWADTEKVISGVSKGAAFTETYTPSKDIKGNYNNEVIYGATAGTDRVTQGVMVLQAKGEGLIPDRVAREMHPVTQDYDPAKLEQMIAKEQMEKAGFSALIASAAAPPGDPRALTLEQLTAIWDELESPGGSLKDALKKHLTPQQVPLAPMPMAGSPALSSPGLAGAGEPQPPDFSGAPPLEQLLG